MPPTIAAPRARRCRTSPTPTTSRRRLLARRQRPRISPSRPTTTTSAWRWPGRWLTRRRSRRRSSDWRPSPTRAASTRPRSSSIVTRWRSTRSGRKARRSAGRSSASATCSTCRRNTTRPSRPTGARCSLLVAGMDSQGAALARSGLARVFAAQGDIAAALDTYGQVLTDARNRLALAPAARTDVATALESIGELQFRLGNTDQARASFDEARRLADADPGTLGTAARRARADRDRRRQVRGGARGLHRESRAVRDGEESRRGRPRLGGHRLQPCGAREVRRRHARVSHGHPHVRGAEEQPRTPAAPGSASRSRSPAPAIMPPRSKAPRRSGRIATVQKSDDLSWRADVRLGEAFRKLSKIDDARRSFQDAVDDHRSSGRRRAGQPRGAPSARRQRQRVERPGARARLAGRRPGRAGRRRGASRPHPPRPARRLPARHHARHHSGRTRRGTGHRPRTDFDERPAHGRALGRKAGPRAARQAAAAARDAGGEARRSAGASLCAPARAPAVARARAGVHRLAGPTRLARGDVCRIPRRRTTSCWP